MGKWKLAKDMREREREKRGKDRWVGTVGWTGRGVGRRIHRRQGDRAAWGGATHSEGGQQGGREGAPKKESEL